MQSTGRAPGSRLRGAAAEELLQQVADAYREAIAAGDPSPRNTLASRFSYTNAHVGRLLVLARRPRDGRPPLLGPARPGPARPERPSRRNRREPLIFCDNAKPDHGEQAIARHPARLTPPAFMR